MMEKARVYSDASDVDANDGAVEVRGPDSVDVDLTPEAAEETAERLTEQSVTARGQRRLMNFPHRPK